MNGVVSRLKPEPSTRNTRTDPAADDLDVVALLPIGADLLPRQTAGARSGRTTRLLAGGVVVLTLLVVVGGWLLAGHASSSADDDLAAAQARSRTLQSQAKGFDDLVTAQTRSRELDAAVAKVMATDTPWSTLLSELAGVRGGVTFTSVQAGVDDPTTATGPPSATATDVTTPGAIGHLAVSGTAPDKPAIASFVEALDGVKGLADPFLSSVTALSDSSAGSGGYSFTVTVALTGDLRTAAPSRWATTTGGGK